MQSQTPLRRPKGNPDGAEAVDAIANAVEKAERES